MIDGHVHLDEGPLTKEYLDKFINEAIKNNIDEIHILNHSHRFKEFSFLYKDCFIGGLQSEWLNREMKDSIYDYINFIKEMKKCSFPIKVLFGLEVCYFEGKEEETKKVLGLYKFDFVIGSIHFIDNIAYDSKWSIDDLWNKKDVDYIYKKYYDLAEKLIKSNLFTQIGHIDTIKMFNYYPSYDLKTTYNRIAKLACNNNIIVENNPKVHYKYNHKDIGLSKELLGILKDNNCLMITSSDAHKPEDISSCFDLLR